MLNSNNCDIHCIALKPHCLLYPLYFKYMTWLTRDTARDEQNAVLNPSQANLHYPPALSMLRSGSPHDPTTPTPIGFRSFSPVDPRPLSGTTLQGTLPRAAIGLQHTQYSRGRSASHQSAESAETVVSYKPPSTIPEESTGNASSPFDTPGKNSTDRIAVADKDETPSQRGERSLTRRLSTKARSLRRRASMLSIRTGLSPMRPNPSHPDLVPPPLAVSKRNSVRESYADADSLGSRYGIDKTRLRRSVSNPPARHSYIDDSDLATPTVLVDRTDTTTPMEESTGKPSDDDSLLSLFELQKYTNMSTSAGQPLLAAHTDLCPSPCPSPCPSSLVLPPPVILIPPATQSEHGTAATDSPSRKDSPSRSSRSRSPTASDDSRPFWLSEMEWRSFH